MWDMLSILGDKLERKEAAGTLNDPICLDNRDVKSYPLPNDPAKQSADVYRAHEIDSGIEISTTGGTSDARFIKKIAPCLEFGLVNKTMHRVDECVSIKDLRNLKKIYYSILLQYLN
jgi:acetylornithine deacetylase/succinyl-diaminopimelate desuccinylase-like protein